MSSINPNFEVYVPVKNHWSQTSGMKRSVTLRHKSQWFLSMIGIFLMHLHEVQATSQRLDGKFRHFNQRTQDFEIMKRGGL